MIWYDIITYRPPGADDREFIYIYIYFFLGGEGCVSLLLFVTEAHWRRRNQKQNRNRNKTTSPSSPSSKLIKISPPTKTTTKSRSSREPENLFFRKTQDQKSCFFHFVEKVPGILEMSWDFHEISLATMVEFKQALDILAPRATIYLGNLDSDHILPRVETRICTSYPEEDMVAV